MALFMDTHTLEGGVSAADVAAAHQADLATQAAYGVDYLRYWVDEEAGTDEPPSWSVQPEQAPEDKHG